MKTIIFDIDGTLADPSHRLHHITLLPHSIVEIEGERGTVLDVREDGLLSVALTDGSTAHVRPDDVKLIKDWKEFYLECSEDTPIEEILHILRCYKALNDWKVICITGRSHDVYDTTISWLSQFNAAPDLLLMRPPENKDHDHIIKREYLKSLRDRGYNPLIAFEDRTSVVEMWRDEGLTCCQVAKGDF